MTDDIEEWKQAASVEAGLRRELKRDQLTDAERQMILRLIDGRITNLSGRLAGAEYPLLVALRRKLEGVDKRITIESQS